MTLDEAAAAINAATARVARLRQEVVQSQQERDAAVAENQALREFVAALQADAGRASPALEAALNGLSDQVADIPV